MKKLIFVLAVLLNHAVYAQQDTQIYTITYNGSPDKISVDIHLPKAHKGPVQLIIPRSAPGEYGVVFWDHYLSSIKGYDAQGNSLSVTRGEGPRWIIGNSSSSVFKIGYQMDLKRMEKEETFSADASIIRPNFAGLLGYSVFGYVEGYEYTPIQLQIKAPDGWPVFTTLQPVTPLIKNEMDLSVGNFDLLADAQIMMGPALQVKRFNEVPVPLYVAQYTETNSSIDAIGKIGVSSMKLLKQYFGQTPFPYYTIFMEYLKPIDSLHNYRYGMEHLNSFTGFAATSFAIEKTPDSITYENAPPVILRTFGWVLHHMCHAYIPLRCYGKGYRPFTWEAAPIIKTIWFNEGFAQYISLHLLDRFDIAKIKGRVDNAPAFINNMSMQELSELASTQYSSDSTVGGQIAARGILLANDLDNYMRGKSSNKKLLRDALIYLLNWSRQNKRAFTIKELPGIFRQATGVNVDAVFEKWMKPVSEIKTQSGY